MAATQSLAKRAKMAGLGAMPKIAKKTPRPPYHSVHTYSMEDGTTHTVNRAPWESAPAFRDRCAYFDSLDPRNTAEAEIAEAKSAMWYNIKYMGCGYDRKLEDSAGNPQTLVVVKPKAAAQPKTAAPAGGSRSQSWMPS